MEFSEECECVFCEKGDNLVFCSGTECLVCVHLKCLEEVTGVVQGKKFYCVCCVYKRGVSECVELRKKKEMARENLESFLGFSLGGNSGGRNESEENVGEICELASDDDDVEKKNGEDNVEGFDKSCDEGAVEGEKQVETNVGCSKGDGEDENICNGGSALIDATRRLIAEKRASTSKQIKKSKESPKKINNTQPITGKRKKVYWSFEEEKILQEGVQKFNSETNKKIPWRKILNFGRLIFDSSRTPVDLKDKWRTMSK